MIIETGLPPDAEAAITFLLPAGVACKRVQGLPRAETLLNRAGGLLLGIAEPVPPTIGHDITRLRRQYPWLPIVVAGAIPRSGFESVHRLALHEAGADRVVSWSDPHFGDGTIAQAWKTLPLRRMAAIVQRSTHLSDVAREQMVRALAAATPLGNVADLATAAGMHRTSLWKAWAKSRREVPTPGIFVDWLHLLHVAVRKDLHRTWAAAALDMGARPSSLARLGKRLLGSPLSEFDDHTRRRIFTQFLRRMVALTPTEIRDYAPIAPPLLAAIAREREQAMAQGAEPTEARDAVAASGTASGSAPGAASGASRSAGVDAEFFGMGASWVF
jgi:AcrR family transcriptional regulator